MRTGPETTLKLIAFAMGGLVVLMAAFEFRNAVAPSEPTSLMRRMDDPQQRELARCRTLTPDDLETDRACRAAWAENRRRFFGVPSNEPEG